MVDYYSKFSEVYCLKNATKARDVINAHKSVFARHGICQTLVTDNGPQYVAEEFKRFAKDWEFTHVTSSLRYSQSNGQAERMVQTVKNLIKKAQDSCYALLVYRTMPLEGIGYAPSQLLMGRRLNTKLPMSKTSLKPHLPDHKLVQQRLNYNQIKQKEYYDRGTNILKQLGQGEGVRVWKEGQWRPGIIQRRAAQPRSYIVQTEKGSMLRRRNKRITRSVRL